ncbi:Ribosomal RNA small subunit methyltransferase I [Chlamydiales bacterium SCGC AG-110-P3]|nr:Ribosomal RNA small subunit methyltransferase I [Chlamydiales bacterium SCGC AG-110-P3]
MLYLVATPIGNLSDITFRAVEILKTCDVILCEDTRHSRPLLSHYGIDRPLRSYHKFNERARCEGLIAEMHEGKTFALISDAGTPGISDPGEIIVAACIDANIPVSATPGPCAAIQALTVSGLPTTLFQFIGFPPRKEQALKDAIIRILEYPGTTICYESARRITSTIALIADYAPTRQCCVARELTKRYEEFIRGTASEVLETLKSRDAIKGEIILILKGGNTNDHWSGLDAMDHVAILEKDYDLSRKEAIKLAAELRGMPKRELYKRNLKENPL